MISDILLQPSGLRPVLQKVKENLDLESGWWFVGLVADWAWVFQNCLRPGVFFCFLLVIWMDLLKCALCWTHIQPKNKTKISGIALFHGVVFNIYLTYVYIQIFVDIYLHITIYREDLFFPSSTICMCIYTYHHISSPLRYNLQGTNISPQKKGTSEHNFPFTQVGKGSVPWKVSPIYIG